MACSDAYLEEHPCAIPFMPDEHGRCSVLIEEHINAHGPSRRIFMAFIFASAFFGLFLNAQRLAELLSDTTLTRRHQGLALVQQPQILTLVCLIYACLLLLLVPVDIKGYGGRIPFIVWYYAEEQVFASLIACGMVFARTWLSLIAEPGANEALRARLRRIDWGYVGAVGSSCFLLPVVEVYARPADAPLGVGNGFVVLLKWALILAYIATITVDFSLELLRVRSHSQPTSCVSVASGSFLRGRKLRVRPTEPPGLADAPSGQKDTASETASTVDPRSVYNAPPAQRHQVRRLNSSAPAHQITSSSLHQMTKLVLGGWSGTACLLAVVVDRAIAARQCWVYTTPPETQWFELWTLMEIFCMAILTVVPLKTHFACGTRSFLPIENASSETA